MTSSQCKVFGLSSSNSIVHIQWVSYPGSEGRNVFGLCARLANVIELNGQDLSVHYLVLFQTNDKDTTQSHAKACNRPTIPLEVSG